MLVLKLLLALEVLVGIAWTLPLLMEGPTGLALLVVFPFTQPLQLLFVLTGLWFLVMRPETRRLAAAVFTVPIGLFVLPFLLRGVFGAPVLAHGWQAVALLAAPGVALLAYCVVMPWRAAEWIPRFVLESRALNVTLMLWVGVGAAGWLTLLGWHARMVNREQSELDPGLVLIAGLVSAGASLPLLLYGYLGLFQRSGAGARRRGLHAAQCALSAILLLASGTAVAALGIALVPLG